MITFPSRIRTTPPAIVRSLRSLLALAGIAAVAGCGTRPQLYMRDSDFELADSTKTMFVVPIDSIRVVYYDETQAKPDTQFTDSFFLDAANSILGVETMKRFAIKEQAPDPHQVDSALEVIRSVRYSRFDKSPATEGQASAAIRTAAQKLGADLVLFVYSCRLRHIVYQPQGWRGGGPSYEKPVTFRAFSATHLQIWNARGTLLYERVGTSDAGRPIMYSLFEKKTPAGDVVKFAQHLYAPPLVRALYMSIQDAMKIRR